ncbi:MAG TPA: DUF4129 domain-containing protein [Opitutales bacterium]|nr:DUF4129 domain-containing protein [Opitutales bacterium]
MKPPQPLSRRAPDLRAMDLVEEATHALRAAPAATLAAYFAGTLPFVLAMVYFWADMSLSPFARSHDAEAALGLAGLYVWMKFWHNVFARRIWAQISATPPVPWSLGRVRRVVVTQAALQPLGLLLLVPPLLMVWVNQGGAGGLLALFPQLLLLTILFLLLATVLIFAVPVAFFQNLGVLDAGDAQPLAELVQRAGLLAGLWKRQNITALMFLTLFAFFVFLNWMTFFILVPYLGHMLLGIESSFTRAGFSSMMNSTALAAMVGLTYLCVDPLLKTVFVLRCFYGEARHSGEDLKARLKIIAASRAAAVLLLGALLLAPPNLRAADAPPPAAPPPAASPGVPPDELDHTINDVIHQDKYAWRLPGEEKTGDEANQSFLTRFLASIREMIHNWAVKFRDWLDDLLDRLRPHPRLGGVAAGLGMGGITLSQALIFTLAALVLCVLGIFLYRYFRNRRGKNKVVQLQPLAAAPDLADENTGAEALPEDGWTKLARELLARGEYRLALRAFYLASLAGLAARNLISLAKFKSNRDYERELRRRGHAFPQMPPVFAEVVGTFERVWYGLHDASPEMVSAFSAQVDKLRRAE